MYGLAEAQNNGAAAASAEIQQRAIRVVDTHQQWPYIV
jgi:hypothetical protein